MKSLVALDYRRLGKQRVEAMQLLKSLHYDNELSSDQIRVDNIVFQSLEDGSRKPYLGWRNHPARKMWDGYEGALAIYHDLSIIAWKRRGYKNTMPFLSVKGDHQLPPWFGRQDFHDSHKSNLLRKDPDWYGDFGWGVPDDLEYIWPS